MTQYNWDWTPSSRAEIEEWLAQSTSKSASIAENVLRSGFADEAIFKVIASQTWGISPALLDFPQMNLEILSWLDERSSLWDMRAQHDYWYKRFLKRWTIGCFSPSLLNSICDYEMASREVFDIAGFFTEQMWHDLTVQGHTTLSYTNGWRGDDFLEPSNSDGANEDILKLFVPASNVEWINKQEGLDFEWARELAETDHGKEHFEENEFADYLDEGNPFPDINMGYAIGAGLEASDVEVLKFEAYRSYLEACYDDREMQEVSISISEDTPWEGVRYRELDQPQQLNLVSNIIATLKHPYLGRPDGISIHLLKCISMHDHTSNPVKDFVLANLPD